MRVQSESRALDHAVLEVIQEWERGVDFDERAFNELALRLFAYQVRRNEPYAAFARTYGYDSERLPSDWRAIPAAPSAAFKDAVLATFDVRRAALRFETSGTSAGVPGTHYMETSDLYDGALRAGFDRFILRGDRTRRRYVMLVPDPAERPGSSLGYMMGRIAAERGGAVSWHVHADTIDVEGAVGAMHAASAERSPVCVATTAFALVHLIDALEQDTRAIALPAGSIVMETGGFKGRSRIVDRNELYDRARVLLGVPREAIVAEYGMTELTSQYYDSFATRALEPRVKAGPPWLRAYCVDSSGNVCAPGEVGRLVHVDLANRSSVIAVSTEDLGYTATGEDAADRLVLLGRPSDAPLRGCSLDAESLATRVWG